MSESFIQVAKPFVGEEEAEAIKEVLLSGQYVSGSKVAEFENAFAGYIGTRHAVAVNNGTAALFVALQALGIRPGDEVIVPPLTFFATVSAVLYHGAVPVFADIKEDHFCLDPESVRSKITPETRAVIPVHLFGAAADMDELTDIAQKSGIDILEDCAQAHGTEYKGRKAGSMGKAGAFSFFATKHMTTGEGGMITTDDPEMADLCRIIRNHGMSGRHGHVCLGFNNRMTEMEAAMGLVQLKKMDELNRRRIENSQYLIDRLSHLSWVRMARPEKDIIHTYFWCPLLVEKGRDKTIEGLKAHLAQKKIGFRHRYLAPLYRQPVLKNLGLDYSPVCLPIAERVAGQVIGLPNHAGLTRKDLDRVIDAVASFKG